MRTRFLVLLISIVLPSIFCGFSDSDMISPESSDNWTQTSATNINHVQDPSITTVQQHSFVSFIEPAQCISKSESCVSVENEKTLVRFATYNISFNRKKQFGLRDELDRGKSTKPKQIAEVIQIVRPDVILLNEFDYDSEGESIKSFRQKYLQIGQNGQQAIKYPFVYFSTVNTGVDSGLDLNNNERTGEANDAFGFGTFPGQYAMVVLSKFPIETERIRTFQKFRWNDMPGCLWPQIPGPQSKPYYSDDVRKIFRLSSKSHWDVPVRIHDTTVHFLVSHPTPPVFDQDEDRNGCRNHDEIRMFSDYVSGKADYLYDDKGKKGGLPPESHFVIAGDLNADPIDGDSRANAIDQLLKNDFINNSFTPKSSGGAYWAKEQGGVNANHKGNPLFDSGDFRDQNVGNMRIDYVLPSKTLTVADSGVFWPMPNEAGSKATFASDHRMVWIDVQFE